MIQWLNDHTEDIRMAENVNEIEFPGGCEYGVYTEDGNWLYGTIEQKKQSQVWQGYQKKDMSSQEGYYRFILRPNQEVCIVKYHLRMRYVLEPLNHILPNLELFLPLVTSFTCSRRACNPLANLLARSTACKRKAKSITSGSKSSRLGKI